MPYLLNLPLPPLIMNSSYFSYHLHLPQPKLYHKSTMLLLQPFPRKSNYQIPLDNYLSTSLVMKKSPLHLLLPPLLHLQLLQMHHQKLHPQIKPPQAKIIHLLLFNQNFKFQPSSSSMNQRASPQPLNPLLENILDVPPRPLNPQPLQSLPSLDITLSLSPITPLENLSSPPSPSLPPPSKPSIQRHPPHYNQSIDLCMDQIGIVVFPQP
ncbi:hypothetical protein Tco_1129645 [Tanacetum coccineum]